MSLEMDTESFSEMKWYVVRTQTKREQAAAGYIRKELGLEVVAPQIRYTKVTRRGKVLWKEAMFPGYVFAKFQRELSERAVCYAPGVLTLVKFGEDVPAIAEGVVMQMASMVGEDEVLDLEHSIEKGMEYEVADGALKGTVGEVLEVLSGGERVMMLMDMIGGPRAVEIDVYSLLLSKPNLEGD